MALRPQHVAPEILNKVTKALGITALDQWYYVSHHTASKSIGSRVLNQFGGSLSSFLKFAYPEHHFDEEKLAPLRINLEQEQNFFGVIIHKLFPNEEIHEKARKSVGIINPETDAYLEIDFWIPSLKLGIEYQDKHHFAYQWYANEALADYKKRDAIKKDAMSRLGYTLITIGYWWDKSIRSVAATIRKVRPDLLRDYEHNPAEPIPLEPPLGYISESPVIPGTAGIMSPFIPSYGFDPTNWFAGEKYDGIRGVYNPSLNKLFSRSGNELSILPSLLKDIPNMLVEGEIVAGRGNYAKTAPVTYHTLHDKVNWPMFRYLLYDIPDAQFGDYTHRYSAVIRGLSAQPYIFAQAVMRVVLANKIHLKMLVDSIISDAGEGVIAQQDSRYEYGRAKGLAKIKVHRDADAQVLQINDTSCTCKLTSGVTTDIIFSDDFDPTNLIVGDVVSYYYNGYSQNGSPKGAEIYKVRYDITWDQAIGDKVPVLHRRSAKEVIGSQSLIASNSVRNKAGYWSKTANIRAFFDKFAQTAGFDPLVANNWYPVRVSALLDAGGGGLLKLGITRKKALSSAYPELTFDAKKFRSHDNSEGRNNWGYWTKPSNVRAFFDEFARTSGFDPLIPQNWYPVMLRALLKAGGGGLLSAYGYDREKVLATAYPELKFDSKKFRTCAKPLVRTKWGQWSKASNVRAFLDDFAQIAGFDALVAENWYAVTISELQHAGGSALLRAHRNSIKEALIFAYPELLLESKKFKSGEKPQVRNNWGHWNEPSNARAFFDDLAQSSGFDPLVPENWNAIRNSTLQIVKRGSGLLQAYENDMKKALKCAYPELQFGATYPR